MVGQIFKTCSALIRFIMCKAVVNKLIHSLGNDLLIYIVVASKENKSLNTYTKLLRVVFELQASKCHTILF